MLYTFKFYREQPNQILHISFIFPNPNLFYFFQKNSYYQKPMQSSSQTNLRSHHDKIGNQAASNTKLRFLSQQVNFHCDFRQQVEVLHQLAKPTLDLNTQINKLRRKITITNKDMQHQIIRIRRECTLMQIDDGLKFESDIGQSYEQTANKLDTRMQTIEELVQRGEDYKKATKCVQGNVNVAFRSYTDKQSIEQYINLRERVKMQIKHRLNLTARLIQMQGAMNKSLLANCKQNNLKQERYHFKSKWSQYYRSKSSQPRQTHVIPVFIDEQSRFNNKKHKDQPTYSKEVLNILQDQIYKESTDSLRLSNSKMQILVQNIRNAITSQEDKRVGIILQANSNLNIQELITRQIIAYRDMNRGMPDKLGACSYLWAKMQNIQQPRLQSNEWDEQTEQSSKISVFQKKRPKSDGKKDRKNVSLSKLQPQNIFHSSHGLP